MEIHGKIFFFNFELKICTNYEGKPPWRAIKRHMHRGKWGTGGGELHCVPLQKTDKLPPIDTRTFLAHFSPAPR